MKTKGRPQSTNVIRDKSFDLWYNDLQQIGLLPHAPAPKVQLQGGPGPLKRSIDDPSGPTTRQSPKKSKWQTNVNRYESGQMSLEELLKQQVN